MIKNNQQNKADMISRTNPFLKREGKDRATFLSHQILVG